MSELEELRAKLKKAEAVILAATHVATAHKMLTSERTKRVTLENFERALDAYEGKGTYPVEGTRA